MIERERESFIQIIDINIDKCDQCWCIRLVSNIYLTFVESIDNGDLPEISMGIAIKQMRITLSLSAFQSTKRIHQRERERLKEDMQKTIILFLKNYDDEWEYTYGTEITCMIYV